MGTVVTYTVYIEPSTQNEDSEPINHLHMMLMLMMNEDSGLESPLPKLCTIGTESL